jgi:hypothetical protein
VRGLSRREFLGGTAGVAAAVALPSGSTRAAVTSLVGATVEPSSYGVTSYLDAAHIFDGFVGLPMATTIEKIYLSPGELPTTPPPKMKALASADCQFLVSMKPSTTLSSSERSALANCLAKFNSAGLSYRVVLFSECNDKGFTMSQWLAYWSYYAPVIKDAGVSCGYNPGCNPNSIGKVGPFFPSNPAPDELWMDYYATAFRGGTRLDPVIAMGQAAGIPTGIAEWGWSAGLVVFSPMVMPWWTAYCNYLVNLANAGKFPLGAILFDGLGPSGGNSGVIDSASDPRIPGIQKVAAAV